MRRYIFSYYGAYVEIYADDEASARESLAAIIEKVNKTHNVTLPPMSSWIKEEDRYMGVEGARF